MLIRPITREDLPAVPRKCWDSAAAQEALLSRQEILGFGAWEGDACVGQLHCYRIELPAWDESLFPGYGRENPRGWPLGWPLQVLKARARVFKGPLWGHACFHVGLIQGARDADPRYFRQGIGSALCEASISWARGHGYVGVLSHGGTHVLPSYNAWMGCLPWKVYERLGFEELGRETLPWWLSPDHCKAAYEEALTAQKANPLTESEICARAMYVDLRGGLNKAIVWDEMRRLRDAVYGGCTEKELEAMRCPTCGAPLRLQVDPVDREAFVLGCAEDALHMFRQGVSPPTIPAWWSKYLGGIWMRD